MSDLRPVVLQVVLGILVTMVAVHPDKVNCWNEVLGVIALHPQDGEVPPIVVVTQTRLTLLKDFLLYSVPLLPLGIARSWVVLPGIDEIHEPNTVLQECQGADAPLHADLDAHPAGLDEWQDEVAGGTHGKFTSIKLRA